MKACKHFQRRGETYITSSDGYPWNAWVTVYDTNGYVVYQSFQTGLRAEYLRHLLENETCRRLVHVTKRLVARELREIEDEWQTVTNKRSVKV